MMTYSRFLPSIAAIIFFLNSTCALAETNEASWYSIEYIVFENNALNNQPLEVWNKEAFQMPADAIALEPSSGKKSFSSLSTQQQQLHGVYRRLEQLSSYTPIAHGGWVQPVQNKQERKSVSIMHQAGTHRIEGTLTFHRERFLHLKVDLQLSEMLPLAINYNYAADTTTSASTLYRLQETRRIKTSQSNYFDHPRFGVLAIVEKINSPYPPTSTSRAVKEQQEPKSIEIKN